MRRKEYIPHGKGCKCDACELRRKQHEVESRKKHAQETELKHNPFAAALRDVRSVTE